MEALAFNKALQAIWELVSAANKYIDDSAPWTLAKDEAQRERLGTVMYNLLEAIRLISLLITPFMPDTGAKICTILGISPDDQQLDKHDSWGLLKPGTMVEKAAPLFPRIET
jgi:methionyl-tRNA synthetase